ncbi:ABC-type nitrate/sulfonate/bicarbonate transport system ATPase subunit [Bradyrhizobium sp. USDA 4341]
MTALSQADATPSASAGRSGAHLDIRNVSRSFVVNGTMIEALKDVSLDVAAGEFVVLLGPSGCGKSTLLRLVAGLDREFRGSISLDGETISGTSLDRGIVFQEPRLFPWATVAQNIALERFPITLRRNQPRRDNFDIPRVRSV